MSDIPAETLWNRREHNGKREVCRLMHDHLSDDCQWEVLRGLRVPAFFTFDETSPIGGHIEIAPRVALPRGAEPETPTDTQKSSCCEGRARPIDRAADFLRHQIWCSTVMVPHLKPECNCGLTAFTEALAGADAEVERLGHELLMEFQRRNLIEESIAQQLTADEAGKALNAVWGYAPASNAETSHHYDSLREKLEATRNSDPANAD